MNSVEIDLGADFGTDLSSRHRAAELRIAIENRSVQNESVTINLSNVRSISHSFADELFAVLLAERGDEWFRQHVQFKAPSPAVRLTILEAIQRRLEELGVEA